VNFGWGLGNLGALGAQNYSIAFLHRTRSHHPPPTTPPPTSQQSWNFGKFLVNRDGSVVKRYGPRTPPSALVPDIEAALAQPAP
jgi:glutathione peroxidase